MPDGFIVGGKIQLEAPTNLKTIAANIQKELGNIKVGVDLNIRRGATTQIATMSRNLERLNTVLATTTTQATSAANAINRLADGFNGVLSSSRTFAQSMSQIATHTKTIKNVTSEASDGLASFGRNAELSAKRFLAFGLAAGTIIKFTQAIREGIGEAISFQREMVRLAQVSTEPANEIRSVEATISKLSTTLGVASRELADVAVTFKQAGLSINDTKIALEAVAEASLAPTFTNTKNTVEGAIAAMQQFKLSANDLKGVLGSINQVSADFAVESNDLVTAIQKSGGAFQAAGGNLNELLAVFTSVRQTTRESADTIATGLRTIFARLQRPQTLNDLEQLGIRLRTTREEAEALGNLNLQEQFVGPFEALRRISEGLNGIQQTDPRFAQVVESIGGLRQLSKVVPAIQQFSVAQNALNSALGGTGSLTRSTIQAQDALIVQVTKLREQYNALFRDLIGSKAFNQFASSVLTLASSFATLVDIIKPLLPLLTALTAIKIGSSIGGLLRGFKDFKPLAALGNFLAGRKAEAPVQLKRGGFVPGSGNGDSVPAMLEPGEFVLSRPAVNAIGKNKVAGLNNLARGGSPVKNDPWRQRFREGGPQWTHEEGEQYLSSIQEQLKTAGVNGKLVGGVAKSGSSRHDLDVLLEGQIAPEIFRKFIGDQSITKDGSIKIGDGRTVDFIYNNQAATNTFGKVAGLAAGGFPLAVGGGEGSAQSRLSDLSKLPKEIQSFVPEGSTFLGGGVEAVAYKLPNGNVARITDGPMLRSTNENVLQAFKTVTSGKFTAEELPFTPSLLDTGEELGPDFAKFRAGLETSGLSELDLHSGNIGRDKTGKLKVIDPGAVLPRKFAKIVDTGALSKDQLHELFTAVRKSGKGYATGGSVFGTDDPDVADVFNLIKQKTGIDASKLATRVAVRNKPAGKFTGSGLFSADPDNPKQRNIDIFTDNINKNALAKSGIDPVDDKRFTIAHELGHALDLKIGDLVRQGAVKGQDRAGGFGSDILPNVEKAGTRFAELQIAKGQLNENAYQEDQLPNEGFANLFADAILGKVNAEGSLGNKNSLKNFQGVFSKYAKFFAKGGPVGQTIFGLFKGFAKGGEVTDKIPAMLTPGEYVINAERAAELGDSALNTLNRGKIPGFAKGGWVGMATGGKGKKPQSQKLLDEFLASERPEPNLNPGVRQPEAEPPFNLSGFKEVTNFLRSMGRSAEQIKDTLDALKARFGAVNEVLGEFTVQLGRTVQQGVSITPAGEKNPSVNIGATRATQGFKVKNTAPTLPEDPLSLDAKAPSDNEIFRLSPIGTPAREEDQRRPLPLSPLAADPGEVFSLRPDRTNTDFVNQASDRADAINRRREQDRFRSENLRNSIPLSDAPIPLSVNNIQPERERGLPLSDDIGTFNLAPIEELPLALSEVTKKVEVYNLAIEQSGIKLSEVTTKVSALETFAVLPPGALPAKPKNIADADFISDRSDETNVNAARLAQTSRAQSSRVRDRSAITIDGGSPPLPPVPRINGGSPPVPPKGPQFRSFDSLTELNNFLKGLGKTESQINDFNTSLNKFGGVVTEATRTVVRFNGSAANIVEVDSRTSRPQQGLFSRIGDRIGTNKIGNFFGLGSNLSDEQRESRNGRLAIGASVALPFIGQALDPGQATADSGGGFVARSAISGGTQGAAFGAGIAGTLGLSVLPVTIAAAGIGIVTALQDAARGIANAQLEKSIQDLSVRLKETEIFGNGGGIKIAGDEIGAIRQQSREAGILNAGIFSTPRGQQAEIDKQEKLAFGGLASSISKELNKEAERLGSTNALDDDEKTRRGQANQLLGGAEITPLVSALSKGTGLSSQAITKQLADTLIAANKRTQQTQIKDSANKVNTQSVNAISIFTDSVLSANKAVENFQRGLETIPGLANGSVGVIAPRSAQSGLESFGLPNNDAFGKTVNQLLTPFGPLGQTVSSTALSFDNIAKVLPVAINNITKSTVDGDNLGAALQTELTTRLGGNLDSGTKKAIAILSDKISDFSLDDLRKKVGTDVSGLSTDLLKAAIGPFQAELAGLGKAFDAEQSRVAQNLASFRQLQQEYNQSLEKVVDAQTDAARTSADIQGRRTGKNPLDIFTREQARRPFEQNQTNLLSGTGIGNTDAAGIGSELRRVQQEIVQRQAAPGGSTTAGQQELSGLVSRASNLKQALDNLANTAKRASDIQDRLNDLKRQEDSRGDILERLFTGDTQQQFDTTQGLALAGKFRDATDQKAFALGLSPEDRKLLLQGVGDLGASTGENLRGQLRNAIGAPLLNPVQEKQAALEGELSTIQQQAIEAQVENSKSLGVLTTTFQTIMENSFVTNAKILSDNILNLANTIKLQAEGRKSAASAAFGDVKPLAQSGLSLDQLKALQNNKSFKTFSQAELENQKLQQFDPSKTKITFNRKFDGGPISGGTVGINKDEILSQIESQLGKGSGERFAKFAAEQSTLFGKGDILNDPVAFGAIRGKFGGNGTAEAAQADIAQRLNILLKDFVDKSKTDNIAIQDKVNLPDNLKPLAGNKDFVDSLNKADFIKLNDAGTAFFEGSAKFTGAVEQLNTIIAAIGPVQNKAGGGSIFKPRGSDTVPAMLTPGEFVVNAKATKNNLGLLHQINDGYANGGVVYARKGQRIFGGNNSVQPQPAASDVVRQIATLPSAAKKAVAEQLGMPTEQVDLGLGGGNLTTFDTILGSGVNTSSFGNMPQNPIYRANGGITDDVKGNPDLLAVQAQQQAILARVQDEANEALVEQQKFEAQRAREKANAPQAFADNVRALLGERDPNLAVPGTVESGVGPANRVAARPNRAAALFATLRENVRNRQNSQSAASSGNGEFLAQAGLRGDNLQRSIQDQILSGALNDLGTVGSVNTGRRKGVPEDPFAAARRVAARRRTLGNSSIQSSTLIGGKINKFADGGIVPAYLHNGEFVVNKQSTSRNVDLLSNINNNPKHFAQGGPVGSVSPSGGGNSPVFNFDQLSTASEVLQSSIRMFAESSSKLSEALASFPSQISLEGKHTVEVIVNGTQALQGILPEVSQLIEKETKAQINKLLQNKFPDAGQEL